MVARPEAPDPSGPGGQPDPVRGLFRAWRRVVTQALKTPGAAGRAAHRSRPVRALGLASRYVTDPAGTLVAATASDRERLKEAGAAALVIGAGIAFAISYAMGTPPARAFLAMGWTAAWALARLLILRWALPDASDGGRLADAAWGPALLPYAAAVVFPLDLAALVLSGFLTRRGLTALGVARVDASRAVAWAFGGQLAVELLAWMGRAGLLAFLRV